MIVDIGPIASQQLGFLYPLFSLKPRGMESRVSLWTVHNMFNFGPVSLFYRGICRGLSLSLCGKTENSTKLISNSDLTEQVIFQVGLWTGDYLW